ncbi:phosphotransferase, partial [Bacillus thuringiensis]|uniref:phosphotransferase n=1 Tax=Bacillus thuringiensis TaxID=1428 RepID=UPI003D6D836A
MHSIQTQSATNKSQTSTSNKYQTYIHPLTHYHLNFLHFNPLLTFLQNHKHLFPNPPITFLHHHFHPPNTIIHNNQFILIDFR